MAYRSGSLSLHSRYVHISQIPPLLSIRQCPVDDSALLVLTDKPPPPNSSLVRYASQQRCGCAAFVVLHSAYLSGRVNKYLLDLVALHLRQPTHQLSYFPGSLRAQWHR